MELLEMKMMSDKIVVTEIEVGGKRFRIGDIVYSKEEVDGGLRSSIKRGGLYKIKSVSSSGIIHFEDNDSYIGYYAERFDTTNDREQFLYSLYGSDVLVNEKINMIWAKFGCPIVNTLIHLIDYRSVKMIEKIGLNEGNRVYITNDRIRVNARLGKNNDGTFNAIVDIPSAANFDILAIEWQEGNFDFDLNEYFGMTKKQYSNWIRKGTILDEQDNRDRNRN